ncbi:MAG: photosynthetic complex assembly protein PuhC [Pseudomonadota bacterium]
MSRSRPRQPSLAILLSALAGTIVLVAAMQYLRTDESAISALDGILVSSALLHFEDTPTGAVEVYSADNGKLLASFESGSGSFVRGILRSLTRDHHSVELKAAPAFLIAKYSDGALMIVDEMTGQRILLNAFGPTNAQVFDRLLTASLAES